MILSNTIKRELGALGIKPNKSLGQNFLVNEGVYKKIAAALEIKGDDIVVEIGPGLGALTEHLAKSGAEIIAVEKDREFAAYLKKKFSGRKNVRIIEGDVLKFNPADYRLQTTNYKLIGNIPYYLTSHLLRIVLEGWPKPEVIVLMLQKEVAQRITARPPNMSLLAVSVQYYAEPEIVSYVSAGSFYPPPKVDSAITKLEIRKRPGLCSRSCFGGVDKIKNRKNDKDFFRIVRAGFSGKRKQLINNLAGGFKLEKGTIGQKLKLAGVDPRRRAETLTVEEWQKITDILSSQD